MADVVILTGVYDDMPSNTRPSYKKVKKLENRNPSDGRHLRTMGAYKIADHLRNNGISVQIIDYIHMMDTETIISYVKKFLPTDKSLPSILGLSTTFFYIEDKKIPSGLIETIVAIKQEYPNCKIVAGGSRAHNLHQKSNHLDWSIYSYSEDITLRLFNGILGKTKFPIDFKLNKKLFEDNTVFDITQDSHRFRKEDCIRPNEALPLEISRGCIFKCTFCRFPYIGKKKNDYIKCVDRIKEELIYNWETFGTTNYYVMDDTFNETPQKVKEFRDMVQELPFKFQWVGYLRCDLIERFPDTAGWLLESGLVGAFFGIESFHPEASKLIGKAWSGKKAKEFLVDLKHNIWKDKVNITVSLIIGLPPETLEDALETNRWLTEHGINFWRWHLLALSRKGADKRKDLSEIEKDPEKYGFTINENDWHNGLISRETATEWFKILNKDSAGKVEQVSNWRSIEHAQWYGLDEVLNAPLSKFTDIKIKKADWFNQYVKLLDNVPPAD